MSATTLSEPPVVAEPPVPPTRRNRIYRPRRIPTYIVLSVLALFAMGPIIAILFNAFKANAEIGANPLRPPSSLSLSNFTTAWTQGDFAVTMRNSLVICVGAVLGSTVLAGLAAYALTFLSPPGGAGVVAYLFLGSALPVQLFVVPLFFLWTQLHLTDNLFGLIVIYWATDAPFATLLLRSFLLKIPSDYVEAARLDGASELRIATKVVLPLARPGILTVGLIVALWAWNEFFWAITFIHDPSKRPISTSFLAFQDQNSTDWGLTSAAALFMLLPVVLLFLVMQRRFVAGLTSGGIK